MKNNLQTAIWLIGIGVLALTGWWWPGIMFVIALSSLIGGSFQGFLWTAGIGLIGWLDFWWPGMLILIGLSFVFGGWREPVEEENAPEWANHPASDRYPPFKEVKPHEENPNEPAIKTAPITRLPAHCPACGGPLNQTTVRWDSDGRAECQWCNSSVKPEP